MFDGQAPDVEIIADGADDVDLDSHSAMGQGKISPSKTRNAR